MSSTAHPIAYCYNLDYQEVSFKNKKGNIP